MRTKLLLGLIAIIVAGAAFVTGILVERYYITPSPPDLINPAEAAVLSNGGKWEFTWSGVPLAQHYRVQVVNRDPNPKKPDEVPNRVFEPQMAAPRHVIDWTNATLYDPLLKGWSWKVKVQVGGRWSDWSEERTFSVEAPAQ